MGNSNCSCQKDQVSKEIAVDTDPRNSSGKIRVTIHKIINYSPLHPIRILCSLTEEGIVILDENGFKCTFYTTYYQPSKKILTVYEIQDPITDKTLENEISFNEETFFPRNLQWILDNQTIKRDLYVSFQLLQRSDTHPTDTEMSVDDMARMSVQSNENVSVSSFARNSASKNRLVGWVLFRLNTNEKKILEGKFISMLVKPPLVRPPFLAGTTTTPTNIKIEFSIN